MNEQTQYSPCVVADSPNLIYVPHQRWDSEEAAAARERADRQRQKEHEIAANKLLRIVSLAVS